LIIPTNADYGKLQFNSGMTGYPAGLTLGNLSGLSANVDFTPGVTGDQPYYLLAFTDSSNSLGQASATDQILMIEFQPSTLSGNTLAVDPNATLFNLYDNTVGSYLQGGQSHTNTLSGWRSTFSSLDNESLQGVWIAEGLAGGSSGVPETLTINSLSVDQKTVPEPATLALVGLGLAGIGFSRRNRAN